MLSAHGRLTTQRRSGSATPGFTLAEVLLSIVLSAIVLGLVTGIGAHLQHQFTREGAQLAESEQLTTAAAVLPPDLRALSPGAGDIRDARDTALEIRSTIGTAIVCGGTARSLILAAYVGPAGRSSSTALQSGDTLWLLDDSDATEQWQPTRLQAVRQTAASCAAITDRTGASVFDVAHPWLADIGDSVAPVAGRVVRATRPVRYSFYRASDGKHYLGARSWNATTSQFNLVQPVSGPYSAVSTRFRYYDSAGVALPLGSMDPRAIARIEVTLVGEPSPSLSTSSDSLVLAVTPRNRR